MANEIDYSKFVKGVKTEASKMAIKAKKRFDYFMLCNVLVYLIAMVLLVLRLFGLV